ncbi:uncharacterized protein LOC115718895 [Cannabis sativa]|uniref:uncharacterized protein LOC115718895 n=1 Tax=Cannabis sativa TaxID=3483 RepID=UPI0029CA9F6E|nr:uncharacterized protein LOC115718895 [Cannabis sativa]
MDSSMMGLRKEQEQENEATSNKSLPNKREGPITNFTTHEINVDVGQDVVSKVIEWVNTSGSLDILSIDGTVSFASFYSPRKNMVSSHYDHCFFKIQRLVCCKNTLNSEKEVILRARICGPTINHVYRGVVRELLASTPVKIRVASYNSARATLSDMAKKTTPTPPPNQNIN